MLLSDASQNFIETDQKSLLDACRSIGAASIKTPTWYRDSLTLYDIFWSTTAALIQLCMLRESMPSPDMRSSAGHSNAESNALQLVLSIKFQLQKHAYISSEMAEARTTEQLQLLLLQDILSTCGIERCQCFKANSEIIQNVVGSPKHSLRIYGNLLERNRSAHSMDRNLFPKLLITLLPTVPLVEM